MRCCAEGEGFFAGKSCFHTMGGVGSGWDDAGAAAPNIDADLKPRAYEPENLV